MWDFWGREVFIWQWESQSLLAVALSGGFPKHREMASVLNSEELDA